MASWRDQILQEFTSRADHLTLVADPDGLLVEEEILAALRERGFDLLTFEDNVAFRLAYESHYRSRWDRGEAVDTVVALQVLNLDPCTLPYDLWQNSRKLSFTLGDLFPNLSYPVVSNLDRSDLDALYRAQVLYNPQPLGDNATKDFILRYVFEIAPELIKEPQDLLRVLLRHHYRGRRLPPLLDERIIQILRLSGRFRDWPLEMIIPDRGAFFAFLQERWPAFLDHRVMAADSRAAENRAVYHPSIPGPIDLPFDHDDVRVYLDNLFLEGYLQPVAHPQAFLVQEKWISAGLRIDPGADWLRRINGLLEKAKEALPGITARHQEWVGFARTWAELVVLRFAGHMADYPDIGERFQALLARVDAAFLAWILQRYAGLYNQPAIPPVMVHHIPRALARNMTGTRTARAALVLIDGLAFDQWVIIRQVLAARTSGWWWQEEGVFAWLPTLTAVSRQAAYAGRPPFYLGEGIYTTAREPALWNQFWIDQGLVKTEIGYMKVPGDGDPGEVDILAGEPRLRVLGLVINKVDKIMHGMQLGTAGMHNQVRQWAEEGYLSGLLELLWARGFDVYLTSDHGNIEAGGCGVPGEGVTAELRGERARVYPSEILRKQVHAQFPGSIAWPPLGLPEDYLPLLAPPRKAFVRQDERIVAHGGISIEEVIVPFIHLERRQV